MYLEHDSISNVFNNIKKTKTKKNNNKGNQNNFSNNIKRNLNETTKKVVASNQKWTCNMCYKMLDASYEIDHTIPLYKGGTNNLENLQALCRNCHGLKTINDKLMN